MSNASGIFPCNTKPQTKRRQKGHAMNRMGSGFSCTSSLHSPSRPTFPCKRLPAWAAVCPWLHFLLLQLSETASGLLEVQTHPFSGSSRQKHCRASHVLSQNLQQGPRKPWRKLVSARWDSRRGSTQIKVLVVISEVLPRVYSVKRGCALLFAICPSWKRAPRN